MADSFLLTQFQFLIFSFLLGAIIGSFLNVVILRLPNSKKLSGRSACPACGHPLAPKDLFPVFSFLWLRGNCRYCKAKISSRYFVIELITALTFAFVAFFMSPTDMLGLLEVFRAWFVVSVLIVVFIIDYEHFLILDKVVFSASGILLVMNIALDILAHRFSLGVLGLTLAGIIGSLVTGGFLLAIWLISKGKWIGFGDVKFMLFMGQVLGFPGAIVGFFLSFFLGTIFSIPLLLFGKKNMKSKLPLGTFLSVGTFITMLYGNEILNWYLSLLGIG